MNPFQAPLNLEIDILRTFLVICESGNFSKAAERVHRTPSAVSLQVKKLEEVLGRAMFRREARSVSLTGEGEILLSYARRLLALNDEAVARFLAQPLDGRISFGAPNDSGIFAIPGFLKRFASTHPNVDVDVVLDVSSALRRRCANGELDLVLFTGEGPANAETIFAEELVWIGLKQGEAQKRRPLPLALADHGCSWRAAALSALDSADIPYRVAYSSEHCQGQIAAIEADLAIAPLPLTVARSAPFVRLDADWGLPPLGRYEVFLLKRDGAGPATDALARHIGESYREAADRGTRLIA